MENVKSEQSSENNGIGRFGNIFMPRYVRILLRVRRTLVRKFIILSLSYCFASEDSFCLVGLIACTFTVCLLIIATIIFYYAIRTRRVRRELQARSRRCTIANRDINDLARYFVDVGYVTAMRHSLPVHNEFKATVREL